MPTRLLREDILTSERVDQLDAPAEVFYRRLMSKVDDYGLYDARPAILRSQLYALRLDRVREADIARWIAACEKAGLIALYEVTAKPYLQMLDTRWSARSEPKFPLRTPENSCKQLKTVAPVFGVVDEGVVGDVVGGKRTRKRGAPAFPKPDDVDDQVWQDWLQLRKAKRAPVTTTALEGARAEAKKADMPLEDFLRVWCRRGSQGLEAEWLKPEERKRPGASQGDAGWRAEQKARTMAAVPGIADPALRAKTVIDAETGGGQHAAIGLG